MRKTIWTCWFQGEESAPPVVKACINSWRRINPGWEFRCLDTTTVERYAIIRDHVDLHQQSLTAASLSDILRILLLHEFGGVWVDATLLCNRPLDEWLPGAMDGGFFAFAEPAPDRLLSSWFLATATPDHYLVSRWHQRALAYWKGIRRSDDYFWFHRQFGELCETDPLAAEAWSRVPKRSADPPHALQVGDRLYRPTHEVLGSVDWQTPVFKLTHRLRQEGIPSECLLAHILNREAGLPSRPEPMRPRRPAVVPTSMASLKVSTENLGDHVQIIAAFRLLSRLGVTPVRYIDRDDEIMSAPQLDEDEGPVGIVLNGWFKTNRIEWPPHPKLAPIFCGFHIRLFQCPELLSDASLAYFRQHEPIGCRDVYTENLLRSNGVEAFTSHCLSLTFPRRADDPATQSEVFVVSRDERIENYLKSKIERYTFISHYSGSTDFAANMARAEYLLETYRSRARLIITTLLHCALPAIAMGIPVVVFYPLNNDTGSASDQERFSSLESLVRIYRLEEIDTVEWNPKAVDIGRLKLQILDHFYELAQRWELPSPPPLAPIAPPSVLPPP